jgi:hypothetical protein
MSEERDGNAMSAARLGFRDALLRSHRTHGLYDELETAAAKYCQVLRHQGCTPEGTIVRAKEVIDEAIDDQDRTVAEKAVLMCIQEYYRGSA